MGGRNNKLCNQRGQNPKGGQAGKETHQKKSCRGSKRPFQCIWSEKKQIKKRRKTILNYKFKLLLNFGIGVRECCIIMGGRNNKLKDQKGLD